MSREPPRSARSLGDRLRNLCRAHQIPEGRARRLIGVMVIGQILHETGIGAIKGATNLEMRMGTTATRLSSDLDTVRNISIEESSA